MKSRFFKVLCTLLVGICMVSTFSACQSNGFRVGVVTGTTFEEKAKEYSKVKEVMLYKDDNLTLQELVNKRIDGVITDRLVGLYGIKQGNFKGLRLAGDFIYKETIAVAVRQEDDALRQAINSALENMISDGTYKTISERYFGRNILEGVDYQKTVSKDVPAKDSSLERVKKAGKIRFAMSGGYPPFNYFTANDALVGFDVEIGKGVAKRLGVQYEPVTTDWSGILEGLRSGRYDGIFGSMAVTTKRLEVVDFTDPYYYSGAQLIVREDSKVKSPDDLK
ncbi:MAG: transporter substrate-binding domain-containing protein [Clostridia bacterium]|nr:transporter substrate-binding domain-containing protein [Clostridia bacterium]